MDCRGIVMLISFLFSVCFLLLPESFEWLLQLVSLKVIEKNFVVYLVRNECGVTISKSNKTYIIGIYNNTQKYLYDGQIKRQCIGMCNNVVEDLALYFRSINY